MNLKYFYTLSFVLFSLILNSQDTYHNSLLQTLSSEYGLENGEWVFFDNEVENLDRTFLYGAADLIPTTTADEEFTLISNILSESIGDFPYDSGWGISNVNPIQENDVCLLAVNLRRTNNVNELGKVTVGLQASDNSEFEEDIIIQLDTEWNQYLIPWQASKDYQIDELIALITLAWEIQEIEIAGISMLNYGNRYELSELPLEVHNDLYGGYEADAAWRAEAAARIEANRKSDLSIEVLDNGGNPVANANVSIEMIDHEFKWGTEIRLDRFAGNIRQEDEFENKLLDLDGEGHTFNWVTPGNSFKWPGIEEGWITSFDEKVRAINWLKENGYEIRFHTLVWPGWINTPFDIEENANDPQYIIDRTTEWLDFILSHPDLENAFDEFDILNEPATNRDYEFTFAGFGPYTTGREFYIEAMNQVSELAPDIPQVINDYVTITTQQTRGTQYDLLKTIIEETIDGGAVLGGIGFECHLNIFPNSLYEVEETLMDFAQYDVPLKITEYDIEDTRFEPELEAKYLGDFLTMIFSIPEVDMFMFWGMWDGNHQFGSGNLFYEDWTPKPAAQVFFDKVFGEWWTEESNNSNINGMASFRPFKGEYQITIDNGTETIIDTVNIIEDSSLSYSLQTTTGLTDLEYDALSIKVFPNPASHVINIESAEKIQQVKLYDSTGKLIYKKNGLNDNQFQINSNKYIDGVYLIEVSIGENLTLSKINIRN